MPRHRLRTATAALMLMLAVCMLACDPAAGDDIAPSINNLIEQSLTPRATSSPERTATSAPIARPATSTGEQPRVLWMLRDHGGTDLAVVRFATNVEAIATLSLVGSPGEPAGVGPRTDTTFATQHTMSIPLAPASGVPQPTFLSLEVTDRQGATASATLEYGDTIAGLQYWARIDGERPAFVWTAPFKGNATWTSIVGGAAPPVSVQLFAKPAGCAPAEQCLATPVATFAADSPTLIERAQRHSIPVELPPTPAQDFQLLYTAVVDDAPSPSRCSTSATSRASPPSPASTDDRPASCPRVSAD